MVVTVATLEPKFIGKLLRLERIRAGEHQAYEKWIHELAVELLRSMNPDAEVSVEAERDGPDKPYPGAGLAAVSTTLLMIGRRPWLASAFIGIDSAIIHCRRTNATTSFNDNEVHFWKTSTKFDPEGPFAVVPPLTLRMLNTLPPMLQADFRGACGGGVNPDQAFAQLLNLFVFEREREINNYAASGQRAAYRVELVERFLRTV